MIARVMHAIEFVLLLVRQLRRPLSRITSDKNCAHSRDSFEGFHQLISDPPFPRFSQRDS